MPHHDKSKCALVTSLLFSLAFNGCMSDKAAEDFGREFGLAFSAPIYHATALTATDLLYCSASFRRKNERWPKDYMELSEFVQQSNGYLWLRKYERVELMQLPEDVLQISFVRTGATNEMKLRLDPGIRKK
jgi:hypothetical protein